VNHNAVAGPHALIGWTPDDVAVLFRGSRRLSVEKTGT
jgi:hypothetical protein